MTQNDIEVFVDADIFCQKTGHHKGAGYLGPAEINPGTIDVLRFISDVLHEIFIYFRYVPFFGTWFWIRSWLVLFSRIICRFANLIIDVTFQKIETCFVAATDIIDMIDAGWSYADAFREGSAVRFLTRMISREIPQRRSRKLRYNLRPKDIFPITTHLLIAQSNKLEYFSAFGNGIDIWKYGSYICDAQSL